MHTELTAAEWKKLDDIIFTVNSSHTVHAIQNDVLSELYPLVPYDSASFFLPDESNNPNIIGRPVTKNWDGSALQEYLRYFQQIDYALWVFRLKDSLIYRDTDIVRHSLRQKPEFFNDFLKRNGLYYAGGISIIHKHTLCGALTLFRSKSCNDFSSKELDILTHLQRHLGNRLYQLLYPEAVTLQTPCMYNTDGIDQVFTSREQQIADLIYRGLETEQIATVLRISPRTVKKHLDNMFKKIHIHSRVQLVKILTDQQSLKVLPK